MSAVEVAFLHFFQASEERLRVKSSTFKSRFFDNDDDASSRVDGAL